MHSLMTIAYGLGKLQGGKLKILYLEVVKKSLKKSKTLVSGLHLSTKYEDLNTGHSVMA